MNIDSSSKEQLTKELVELCHRIPHLERQSEEQVRSCEELKELEERYRD